MITDSLKPINVIFDYLGPFQSSTEGIPPYEMFELEVSRTIFPNNQPPTKVAFVDVDGVLYDDPYGDLYSSINAKAIELFPMAAKAQGKYQDFQKFSLMQQYTAKSYFFDSTAVKLIDALISASQKTSRVLIVISSSWRVARSITQLRTMFSKHNFSKYVLDKTPDAHLSKFISDLWKTEGAHFSEMLDDENDQNLITSVRDRGKEIQAWLKANQTALNVTNFVIIDDVDDNLRALFPDNFVKVNQLLNPKEFEKAKQILNPSAQESEITTTIPQTIQRAEEHAATTSQTSSVKEQDIGTTSESPNKDADVVTRINYISKGIFAKLGQK